MKSRIWEIRKYGSVREREQHGNGMAIEAPSTERDGNR